MWHRRCLAALSGRLRRVMAGQGDRGSAVVEFLGVSLLLLVPLVYLVITLSQVQGATFAAEGAARDAGRLIAQAESFDQGVAAAQLAVELSFADQGFTVDGASALEVQCQLDPCLSPGGYVYITVRSDVGLPGAPGFLSLPAAAQIQADAMTAIPTYRQALP